MRALPTPALPRPLLQIEGLRVSVMAPWVGAIALVGLGLRLAWAAYAETIPLGGDPHWYYVVGQNLANGFGFVADRNELWEIPGPGEPTAFWPPGYPFALAAVFKLFGVGWTQAQVLNAVLGALAVPFVYAIGARCFGRSVGVAAALLYAILPNAILGVPLLFPEPLFVLLFLAATWLLVAYPLESGQAWPALVAFGLLLGIAMLTRGQGAVLLPVAALYWVGAAGWKAALRTTALAAVVAAAVIAPWTVRNAVEMHAFIPISTNSGAALRVGHAPDSIGTTRWTDDEIDGFRMWESIYHPEWEVTGYREYTRLAITYALTHPMRELELSGLKIYHLYRGESSTINWLNTLGATPVGSEEFEHALRHVIDYAYYVLLFGGLLAAPLWLRRDPAKLVLVNVVVIWTLFHVVFLGEPRYHVPLYPVLALSFSAGLWTVGGALARRLRRPAGT